MSSVQKIIGLRIRTLRQQQRISLETLAAKADVSYQYLSGIETGKENFTVQVLESLAKALSVPVRALVVSAYDGVSGIAAPTLNPKYLRPQVPLPQGLSVEHILSAANLTQSVIHCLNYNLHLEVGQSLRSFIQGNNFSGIVSNVLSDSISKFSPYKNNHDQKYPDLICPDCDQGKPIGLEVKTTVKPGKGGESHNGHSGWHIIACYKLLESGDIKFIHLMFAHLNGHQTENPDWKYLGSRVNSETGSQRTETYTTNLKGITKLRDGSLYFDRDVISCRRWKQDRDVSMPVWSIFADN